MNEDRGIRCTRYSTLASQIGGVCLLLSWFLMLNLSVVGGVEVVPIYLVGGVVLFSNSCSIREGRVYVRNFFRSESWLLSDVGLTIHEVNMHRVTSRYAALTVDGLVVPIFAYGLGARSTTAGKRLKVLQKKVSESSGIAVPIAL
jgi:hypothetical protein